MDPNGIESGRDDDGSLAIHLECRPPFPPRSADVEVPIERWRPMERSLPIER